MAESKNAEERAAKYLDIAKINQEQLWKRRQIEWRTNFGLWAAMAIGAGFAYMHLNRPVSDFARFAIVFCAVFVYGTAVYFHIRHMKAIFISNEMDLDLINYNISRAEWELDPDVLKKPEFPSWVNEKHDARWRKEYYAERKQKMTLLYTPVGITVLIAILSVGLFLIMAMETQASQPSKERPICHKVECQKEHCQQEQTTHRHFHRKNHRHDFYNE